MSAAIRILIVEDLPIDADLAMRETRKSLPDCVFQRVETQAAYLEALEQFQPDLILSDYHLPRFNGRQALQLALERAPLIPVIILTGSMNEDIAVECMKAGAFNYVIKENIKRLGTAILHTLEEKAVRLERQRAEDALHESEARYRSLIQSAPDGIISFDQSGEIVGWNEGAEHLFGYTADEARGQPVSLVIPARAISVERPDRGPASPTREVVGTCHDGRAVPVELALGEWQVGGHQFYTAIVRDITERKQADRLIHRRTEDLAMVNGLNAALNRGEPLDRILQLLAKEMNSMIPGCRGVAVYLLTADADRLEMRGLTLPPALIDKIEHLIRQPIPRLEIPLRPDSYFHKMLATEQGTITSDPAILQQWMAEYAETPLIPAAARAGLRLLLPQISRLLQIQSVVTVPLIASGRPIGLLEVSNEGMFTDDDLRRIRNLSGQVTTAILRREADDQLRRQLEYLTAMRDINRSIESTFDLELSIQALIMHAFTPLAVDAIDVVLLDPHLATVQSVAERGFRPSAQRRADGRLGQGLAGLVAKQQHMVQFCDLALAGPQATLDPRVQAEGFVSYCGTPLSVKGKTVGVLEVFHRTSVQRDQAWFDFFDALARQTAIAIDNAQLVEGLHRSNAELLQAYDATILGWSRALDLRDHATEGHTQRATALTLDIARLMGIDRASLVHVQRGALLHDIGKLGVPDAILHKPSGLTPDEWTLMRQHPVYAYDMLAPIAYLQAALDIPYCHHEKWDGTGYPRGLRGEQIPLAARIFAIVDNYDALTSDRPYRLAWSKDKTIAHLRTLAGTHFDPQVVDWFLQVVAERS